MFVTDFNRQEEKDMEKTGKKKEVVNRIGQGKYYSDPAIHKVTIPREMANQLDFQHRENVDVEILGSKRILITGKKSGQKE